jgi:hypothetical protein
MGSLWTGQDDGACRGVSRRRPCALASAAARPAARGADRGRSCGAG